MQDPNIYPLKSYTFVHDQCVLCGYWHDAKDGGLVYYDATAKDHFRVSISDFVTSAQKE